MKLTNPEIHNYQKEPICENHMHIKDLHTAEETEGIIANIMRHYNYGKASICCMPVNEAPMSDPGQNALAFYLKDKLSPKIYVNAGLHHHLDERDTSDFYLNQIKAYHQMGCDGIKMLEGKMHLHRRLHAPKLDDPVYDKFYGYAEQNRLPIVMHLGDPLNNWDLSKMSEYAIKKGWYCTPEDPTREQLRSEVDGILKKFPKITLILAHFYFMSSEPDRAAKMFDTYENLYFDLTPGGEMFVNFSKNPTKSREFFMKYSHKLLYGTDTYNFALNGADEEERYGTRINQLRTFLEKDIEFMAPELSKNPLHGLKLEKKQLDNIYRDNFSRLYGSTPRALNPQKILEECEYVCREYQLEPIMARNMQIVQEYFKSKI